MSNTIFLHGTESIEIERCKPQSNGTENVTIRVLGLPGSPSTDIHLFGSTDTPERPIPATIQEPALTVADIEPGRAYRVHGHVDQHGCVLEDRGVVYVTNVISEPGDGDRVISVEGVWFDADYTDTRQRAGQDAEYRSPGLMSYRPVTRI